MSQAEPIFTAEQQATFRRIYGLDCSLAWTPELAQRPRGWRDEAEDLARDLSIGAWRLHESRLCALLGNNKLDPATGRFVPALGGDGPITPINPDDDQTPAIAIPGGELITVVEARQIIDATYAAVARLSELLYADAQQRPAT